MPVLMNEDDVKNILEQASNQIVGITFVKRTTGEIRKLNGLLKCKKYLEFGHKRYDLKKYKLQPVFDLKLASKLPSNEKYKAYRCFGIDSVVAITAGGKTYVA